MTSEGEWEDRYCHGCNEHYDPAEESHVGHENHEFCLPTQIVRAAEKMRGFADLYGDENSQSGAAHAAVLDWMEEVAAWQCEGLGTVHSIEETNYPDMWAAMVEHATKVARIWLGEDEELAARAERRFHDLGDGTVRPCYSPHPCLMCAENDTPPVSADDLPGMWEPSDLTGGWSDRDWVPCSDVDEHAEHDKHCGQDEIGDWWRPVHPPEAGKS